MVGLSIQNIIFDWDGTLAKTLEIWLTGYQQALERRALSFEPDEIVAEFFHNHHEVSDKHPDINFPMIAEETRAHVSHAAHTVDLYHGAIETLVTLKNSGLKLSLVSSSSRPLLTSGLSANGLTDFFVSVIAGDDGYGHKPNTQPFTETLERMDAKASETLVIGDSLVDIQAGMSVGCTTCLFAPLQNKLFHNFDHQKSMNADHEIDHLPDLIKHVRRIG